MFLKVGLKLSGTAELLVKGKRVLNPTKRNEHEENTLRELELLF